MSVFSFGELHKYGRSAAKTKLRNEQRNNADPRIWRQVERVRPPSVSGNARSISACGKIVLSSAMLQTPRSIARTRTANTRMVSNATSITNASTAWRRRSCVRTVSCSTPWIARSTSATTSSTSIAATVSNYVRYDKMQRYFDEETFRKINTSVADIE